MRPGKTIVKRRSDNTWDMFINSEDRQEWIVVFYSHQHIQIKRLYFSFDGCLVNVLFCFDCCKFGARGLLTRELYGRSNSSGTK